VDHREERVAVQGPVRAMRVEVAAPEDPPAQAWVAQHPEHRAVLAVRARRVERDQRRELEPPVVEAGPVRGAADPAAAAVAGVNSNVRL
jgi:hypothetical protein